MAGRRKYWRLASKFAWEETVETLHLNRLVGFMGWLVASITVLAGLFFWGSADASRDELLTRLFVAFVTVAFIPFVFAWKLVGTPPKMHWDLRGWVKDLEGSILESEQTDKAIYAVNDRYNEGRRLIEEGAEDEALLKWEEEFDAFIKENFDASCYLHLCTPAHPTINYTVIHNNPGRGEIVRNDPPDLGVAGRIEAKLQNTRHWMSLLGGYYRGRSIYSIQFMAGEIRRSGLREHRLLTGTE